LDAAGHELCCALAPLALSVPPPRADRPSSSFHRSPQRQRKRSSAPAPSTRTARPRTVRRTQPPSPPQARRRYFVLFATSGARSDTHDQLGPIVVDIERTIADSKRRRPIPRITSLACTQLSATGSPTSAARARPAPARAVAGRAVLSGFPNSAVIGEGALARGSRQSTRPGRSDGFSPQAMQQWRSAVSLLVHTEHLATGRSPFAAPHHRRDGLVFCWPSNKGKQDRPSPRGRSRPPQVPL
jgi:hypothetical protein